MTTHTLLLNASYEPLGVITWMRAIELLFGEKVYVLESYDQMARSPSVCVPIPAVVALKRYVPYRPKVKFSRKNIYIRDEFTCQYCGQDANKLKDRVKALTFDHVFPKSRGGQTEWTNIVTACWDCNLKKGARTPEEAGMKLLRKPFEPRLLTMLTIPSGLSPKTPDQWRDYLYWETPLEK